MKSIFHNLNNYMDTINALIIHELKSPLDAIRALVHDFKETDPLNPQITILEKYVDHSQMLVSMLVQWYTTKNTGVAKKSKFFSISSLFHELKGIYENVVDKKAMSISFTYMDDFVLNNHMDYIHLILSNLINNAVRHSECSQVAVSAVKNKNGSVEICVADNGKGFPLNMQNHISAILNNSNTAEHEPRSLGFFIIASLLAECNAHLEFTTSSGGSIFILGFNNQV